jgi:hypothetical protein
LTKYTFGDKVILSNADNRHTEEIPTAVTTKEKAKGSLSLNPDTLDYLSHRYELIYTRLQAQKQKQKGYTLHKEEIY